MENKRNIEHLITSKSVVYLVPTSDGTMKGKIFSEYYKKTCTFMNEYEMLQGIEDMLNSLNFPQPCFKERKFEQKRVAQIIEKVDEAVDDKSNKSAEGFKSTFIVNVMYRKNASWQGAITWVEKNQTQNFRSALEMLKLMEQAINDGKIRLVQWKK